MMASASQTTRSHHSVKKVVSEGGSSVERSRPEYAMVARIRGTKMTDTAVPSDLWRRTNQCFRNLRTMCSLGPSVRAERFFANILRREDEKRCEHSRENCG